jgi:hypothetical protein
MDRIISIFFHFVKVLLGQVNRNLNEDALLQIAKDECLKNAWPFEEPIKISEHLNYFEIRTNLDMRGGNAVIKIDNTTGAIIGSRITNR